MHGTGYTLRVTHLVHARYRAHVTGYSPGTLHGTGHTLRGTHTILCHGGDVHGPAGHLGHPGQHGHGDCSFGTTFVWHHIILGLLISILAPHYCGHINFWQLTTLLSPQFSVALHYCGNTLLCHHIIGHHISVAQHYCGTTILSHNGKGHLVI